MIKLTDISKTYSTRTGRVQILDTVNLEINSGERLGILGRRQIHPDTVD